MDDKEKQCVEECMNQEMEKVQLNYLFYIILATAIATAIALYISPSYFVAVDDKEGLYRFILISVPKALMAQSVLLASSVFADFIVPGDLLKRITETSIGSAIYAGLVIIGVAIAM